VANPENAWIDSALTASAFVVALAITALGGRAFEAHGARVVATQVAEAPQGVGDPVWAKVRPVHLPTTTPDRNGVRLIVFRAITDGRSLFLLAEWPDATPDMTFAALGTSEQQSRLLRDELEVLLARSGDVHPYSGAARKDSAGAWVWKAQWQTAVDKGRVAAIHRQDSREYVDYYPSPGDPVFVPARYLGNPNTLEDRTSAAEWRLHLPDRSGLIGVGNELYGKGIWQDGRWRVFLQAPLPTSEDGAATDLRHPHDLVFSITDGGRGEGPGARSISRPVTLYLPGGLE
jgi:hypothetical protein